MSLKIILIFNLDGKWLQTFVCVSFQKVETTVPRFWQVTVVLWLALLPHKKKFLFAGRL